MAKKARSRSLLPVQRRCSEDSGEVEMPIETPARDILINVETLVNVDEKKVQQFNINVMFMGQTLTETPKISIKQGGFADINSQSKIKLDEPSAPLIDQLLAHPVLFIVNDLSPPPPRLEIGKPGKGSKGSKPPSAKPSQKSSKSGTPSAPKLNVLGIGNVDLSSFVFGTQTFRRERVLMELEKKAVAQEVVSWTNLPQLIVSITTESEILIPEPINRMNNVIGVTVESVYNAPASMAEGIFFDVKFPVPKYTDKTEDIVFSQGTRINLKDCECRKRWQTLLSVEGRGGLSQHKISHDACDILNPLENVDMDKILNEDIPRIHWNQWRNSILAKTGANMLEKKITRYRVWPVEILPAGKPAAAKGAKGAKGSKGGKADKKGKDASAERYLAFLNLGSLLYPGVTKVRVASQLRTYSPADLVKKWGAEFAPQPGGPTSTPQGKGKPSSAKSAHAEPLLDLETPGNPLFNESGQPVFIVVEVELWKPFSPKRSPEFLEEKLSAYLSLKGKISRKQMNLDLAEENFGKTIEVLSGVIREEFRTFMEVHHRKDMCLEDVEDLFYEYLCHSGTFQNVRVSLQNRVVDLVGEKYGSTIDYLETLPDIYVYLVEKMHKVLNSTVREWGEFSRSFKTEPSDLQLFAEEAIEEDENTLARSYLLQKIERDKKNPDYWLDYAIFCMGAEENDKAVELVREALSWDSSHQMGLLLYGLVLVKINDYFDAEVAFQTLLDKYPDFIEGWMTLHLFYLKIENHEGAEVTLQTAAKLEYGNRTGEPGEGENKTEPCCRRTDIPANLEEAYDILSDGKYGMSSYVRGTSPADPLSWTTRLCPKRSLNIRTAVLLMKLRAFKFAEMALAQELILEKRGRSVPYLYYLSVSHYLSGRYSEAISHLDVAVREIGKDCSLWSLMGHSHHKLKNYTQAIDCYEYVMESYNRPDDVHLVFLRMGQYYLRTNKFECAKRVLTAACKYTPTPRTWVGIGIACSSMSRFEEAEEAFLEANNQDSSCPKIWAHLAIVNVRLDKHAVFLRCAREAIKKNLKDKPLLKEIKALSSMHGYKIDL